MPGTLHQGLLLLFKDDPWLAFDLLDVPRPVEGTPIDRRAELERDGPAPLSVRQRYPDLVLVYRDPDDERVGIVITVEAQRKLDLAKRWGIPVYQSHLAEDHKLGCWVVVVSTDPKASAAVRAWSQGEPPKIDVMLIDVDSVPRSLIENHERPMAAILAGTLHGHAGDFDAARVAFHLALSLPSSQRKRHAMTVLSALPEHEANQLIGEIPVEEQDPWMEWELESGLYKLAQKAGLEQGREQGLEQGRAEAHTEIRAALVRLIFDLLEQRGVEPDEHSAAQIHGCEDLETLQRWIRSSATATRVAELFEA